MELFDAYNDQGQMLGIQTEDNGRYPLHHASFDFDEVVLETGVEYFMTLAQHFAQ